MTASETGIEHLRERGCSVSHRLRAATGVVCPVSVGRELLDSGAAVIDSLRQPHDLAADVYVQADLVWPSFSGSGVTIAVLDTGVQDDHSELADSMLLTANFAGGPSQDHEGHGTHVAGITAGDGLTEITNTSGYPSPNRATGLSPDGGILAGKVCGDSGCFDSDIVAGIEWALDNGAQVINLSLGGGNLGDHCDGDFLAQQINAAVDAGAVVVASSGNDNAGVSSPACASKAIAVGAVYHADIGSQAYTDEGGTLCTDPATAPDQRVCFSNTGSALDIMAPGAAVLSSYSCHAPLPPGGNCTRDWYAWFWGTSMAAPHVTGAAALMLQADPSLTPNDVKSILESTARDLGVTGRDDLSGWGLLDAQADVEAAAAVATPTPTGTPTNTPTPTATATATSTPTETPCADHDGDTICDSADLDDDNDGCSDEQEKGPDENLGGRRDPKNFWDFFDADRDGSVSGLDIFAVLSRFNAEWETPLTKEEALAEAVQPPPAPPAYHVSHDRTSPGTEDDLWDTGPPDWAISGLDFFAVLAQFNHECG